MKRYTATVTPAGAAESASGEAFVELDGPKKVYAIFLDYTGQPTTADVTVTDQLTAQVFAKSNANADGVFYPRVAASKGDGTASTLTEVCPVSEQLVVAVAQGSAGTVRAVVYAE